MKAAELLGISTRQVHRQYLCWRERGVPGQLHRSCGRASPRRTDDREKACAMALYQERYAGFGPTLLSEQLQTASSSGIRVRRWPARPREVAGVLCCCACSPAT